MAAAPSHAPTRTQPAPLGYPVGVSGGEVSELAWLTGHYGVGSQNERHRTPRRWAVALIGNKPLKEEGNVRISSCADFISSVSDKEHQCCFRQKRPSLADWLSTTIGPDHEDAICDERE